MLDNFTFNSPLIVETSKSQNLRSCSEEDRSFVGETTRGVTPMELTAKILKCAVEIEGETRY